MPPTSAMVVALATREQDAQLPPAASTESPATTVAAAAPPANALAAAPAATPAVQSYALVDSKSVTPHSPAEDNSIMDISVEENSSSWESKRNSAPVSKPITAPPLPSLSKDPQLFHLGEYLRKYKLNHRPSNFQPRGLLNRGNRCYIHATLQALVACPPFYNLMKSLPHTPKDGNPSESCTPIIDSIVRFIHEFPQGSRGDHISRARQQAQKLKANSATVEVPVGAAFEPTYVYRMLSAIGCNTFGVGGSQEDAEEFLSTLLNGLHEEMLAMGPVVPGHDFGRTPLSDVFRGVLRSCVIRNDGHTSYTTHSMQHFFALQLDIEKSKSVNDALELYSSIEMLEGMTCPKTKKEILAWQQVELEELPPVLVLHLKCFTYTMNGDYYKICKEVEYPIDLKVQSRSSSSRGESDSTPKNTYRLFAGKEVSFGHYVTYAYHFGRGHWLRYDDRRVTIVGVQEVLHPRRPRMPYLLFYSRRQDACS